MLGALNVLLSQVLLPVKLMAGVSAGQLIFFIIVIVGTTTASHRLRWPGSGFPRFSRLTGLAGSVSRLLKTYVDIGATRFGTAVGVCIRIIVVVFDAGLVAALAVALLGLISQLCFGCLAQLFGGSIAANGRTSFLLIFGRFRLGSHAKLLVLARH
jgi:hypothetical protein